MDTKGGMGGGMNWEIGVDIHILLCIKQIMRTYRSTGNSLYSVLCGDLNGKEIQKRGDTRICIADSLCCAVEINTTL